MKISIITVTFNAEKEIEKTLNSIEKQDYYDFEIIIMDGGSTDKTLEKIAKYNSLAHRMHVYSEKDEGIYDAMNKAVKKSNSDYVFFLNAGDIFANDRVLSTISVFLTNSKIVYGNALSLDNCNELYYYRRGAFNKYRLACTNICHQTIFYPRYVFDTNVFCLKYRLFADWYLNMQLWHNMARRFKYVDIDISIYENGGVSATCRDKNFEADVHQHICRYLGIDSLIYIATRKILKIFKLIK